MKRLRTVACTCFLLPLAFASCTSWHTYDMSPSRIIPEHRPGKVRVTLADGSQLVARQPVVSDSTLVWTDWTRQVPWARVPLTAVTRIEVGRFDAGRTWGLFLVSAPVLFYTTFAILMATGPQS